ncbi:MAG TPA: DNA-3-methyladenine glycosylase [Pyrinomonadaceae bacterium]|nr:DNA-3-methyladenine glycosylase [Pyrinomonadaceae bacterium]
MAITVPKQRIASQFFETEDTISAARQILGKLLVVPNENGERISAMIVEVEAYCGITDRAAHSYGGRRTPRNEVTYGPGGHAYVFFIYGMYFQLNFVLGPIDHPHVLLIRAVEPIEGIQVMRSRRGLSEPEAIATGSARSRDKNLTSGPGKLCIALGIDRSFNGEDLVEGERIWIENHCEFTNDEIAIGKRIGIDYAGEDADLPWRFWVKGNQYVSKPRVPIE